MSSNDEHANIPCSVCGLQTWVGCQKNVFLDKGSVYKAYTFREEVVGSQVLYEPRWKRSDECSSVGKPKFEQAVDVHHFLQNISYSYVISFFVALFIACVLLIVISSLTQVVEMCYEYECLVMWFSWCTQVLCDYYYQLC